MTAETKFEPSNVNVRIKISALCRTARGNRLPRLDMAESRGDIGARFS
jgi:hypothetical protein